MFEPKTRGIVTSLEGFGVLRLFIASEPYQKDALSHSYPDRSFRTFEFLTVNSRPSKAVASWTVASELREILNRSDRSHRSRLNHSGGSYFWKQLRYRGPATWMRFASYLGEDDARTLGGASNGSEMQRFVKLDAKKC